MKKHSLYRIWVGMKDRCYNPNRKDYHLYGGRGIRVCDRWLNSFWAFVEDMGLRPSANHSIDRFPDNDGNYEPTNCRWATSEEQIMNSRFNKPKLSKEQRLEISYRLKAGERNITLSKEFGVSKSLITRINNRT